LVLFALAGSARAQEVAPAADTAAPPAGDAAAAPAPAPEAAAAPAAAPAGGTSYVSRGLTQTAGNLQVMVPVVLNLSKDAVLKPVWVPLDLRYGINDQLEVFVAHTPFGWTPAMGFGGVCLGGTSRGCAKMYNNVSVGAQYSLLKDGAMELTGIGALDVRSLDPMYLAVNVGVGFKYIAGQLAIKAQPLISIAATKRSEQVKEVIAVPVQVAFQATPELAVFLDTGFFSPTKELSKSYIVPVGIGASFAALPNLDVGGEFMLPAMLTGAEGDKAFDSRTLMVFGSYRLK